MTPIGQVVYTSPWIPPEWVEAHGLGARWVGAVALAGRAEVTLHQGRCSHAATVVSHRWEAEPGVVAVVTSTTCDQMRYATAWMEQNSAVPVFLLNVPATWQTAAARNQYKAELARLGRFLASVGGTQPNGERLVVAASRWQQKRDGFLQRCEALSGSLLGRSLWRLHSPVDSTAGRSAVAGGTTKQRPEQSRRLSDEWKQQHERHGERPFCRLAIVGGPLLPCDCPLYQIVQQAGGQVVLDATEWGQRTLPGRIDAARFAADPLEELAAAYFDVIPDVFRRPNDPMYAWLAEHVEDVRAEGLIVVRRVWCDLWHGEHVRLRERLGLPVLQIDIEQDDLPARERIASRVESFVEMLRCTRLPSKSR